MTAATNPQLRVKTPQAIAALIDHTLLKPEAIEEDIQRLCGEAREFQFASVCINPWWVRFARQALSGSEVRVCTVVGFPLGANRTAVKIEEASLALREGAGELDMVLNVGALRDGELPLVADEIRQLAAVAHAGSALLKVILETCLLSDEQKTAACRAAVQAGADFVKTSTGFSSGGATVEDVSLMRRVVGPEVGVKASGGVRSLAALERMVAAGANRIGTSSGVSIVREAAIGSGARAASEAAPGAY